MEPWFKIYTTTEINLLNIVETPKDNSVPFYQGVVSKIQTTYHKQEPYKRYSSM